MPFKENLDEFMATTDFAVAATYTPAGGSPAAIVGHFIDADSDPFGAVEGHNPAFWCKASDMPALMLGDALTINGVNYTIAARDESDRMQPGDHSGLLKLRLKEL
jgi:hypothetical protein